MGLVEIADWAALAGHCDIVVVRFIFVGIF